MGALAPIMVRSINRCARPESACCATEGMGLGEVTVSAGFRAIDGGAAERRRTLPRAARKIHRSIPVLHAPKCPSRVISCGRPSMEFWQIIVAEIREDYTAYVFALLIITAGLVRQLANRDERRRLLV